MSEAITIIITIGTPIDIDVSGDTIALNVSQPEGITVVTDQPDGITIEVK